MWICWYLPLAILSLGSWGGPWSGAPLPLILFIYFFLFQRHPPKPLGQPPPDFFLFFFFSFQCFSSSFGDWRDFVVSSMQHLTPSIFEYIYICIFLFKVKLRSYHCSLQDVILFRLYLTGATGPREWYSAVLAWSKWKVLTSRSFLACAYFPFLQPSKAE